MANLKSLAKDTAIYGLSSIVGRFLNYLLVPLYTHYMPKASGDYGISTNVYAYTALFLVLLTFGMETTLFRFANDEKAKPDTVFSTAMTVVASLTALFLLLVFAFIGPISGARGMMVDAMTTFGADSFVGRLSCVFQGSTDTTFYILAVYFGSVGVRYTRHAVACGLLADLAGIISAILICYMFFG